MSKKLLVMASIVTMLVGCGGDPVAEVDQQLEAYKNASVAKIEPIPSFAGDEPANYEVKTLRSPFTPRSVHQHLKDFKPRYVKLDLNRKKYPLEQFSLDSLKMHGVLSKGGKLDAMIQTPNGDFTVVRVGEYIGQNHGHITKITEDGMDIVEAIPDGLGNHVERLYQFVKVEVPLEVNH